MLRDQLFNHPGSLIAGCAIWVPIGLWVVALLHWAIQGDVDFIPAFAGILVGMGLGMTALLAKEPYMAPLILAAVLITMAAFPVVRSSLNKRALDQIDADAIERAYDALSQRPGNAAAMFKLARTIYNKGMPGHAIALAEIAVQQMPEAMFAEEHKILKTWRQYRTPQATALACLECGALNNPGLTHCHRCGARFLLDHARGSWVGRGLAKKFIAAWVTLMVALVGIPFAGGALPPAAAIPVIIGLMVLAVLVLAVTFKPAGATSK